MNSARQPSDGIFPTQSREREDVYYTYPRPLPRIWLSEDYGPSTGRKRPASVKGDSNTSGNQPTAKKTAGCCSYRAKTSEKYSEYEHLHDLSFRNLYMGFVRSTTAHGLPRIHEANGCVKRTFWSVLTLFLIGVWLWNSHSVLSSFLQYGVTVSYDIRLAHEVQFPAVTICNQNVARSSKMSKDPDGKNILEKSSDALFNRNPGGGGSGPSSGGGGSGPSSGGGGSGPSTGGGGPGPSAGGGGSSSSAGGGGSSSSAGGGGSSSSAGGGGSSSSAGGGGSSSSAGGGGSSSSAGGGGSSSSAGGGGSSSSAGGGGSSSSAGGGGSSSSAGGGGSSSSAGGGGSGTASGGSLLRSIRASGRDSAGSVEVEAVLAANAQAQAPQQQTPAPAPAPAARPPGLATERNEVSQRKVLIQEFLIGLDPETRVDYGHQFQPLISDAQYSGYEVYNTTFKSSYDLSYGNCYTFNTGANGTEDSLFAYNTGPDYGLAIVFVIEEGEYIGEITYKQGLRVVVHNPASPPFPAEQGIDVAPGMSTAIGVRKVTINRLGGLYNKCVNMSVPHTDINVYEELYDWTSYTIIGCQKTCYQQAVIETCGCFDHYFPETGIAFAGTVSVGMCSLSNETQDDCKTVIYDDLRNGKLLCTHCQKPCTEGYFETSISSAIWPAKKYIPTLIEMFEGNPYMEQMLATGQYQENIGLLEVYFESLNLEEMTEQPAYDSSQFIADIGGTIGLWVGASMMTIFEFGEFFLDAFVLFLAKCFRFNEERPDELRRRRDRELQQTNPGLPLRRVRDPETNWNYASSLKRPVLGNSGIHSDDWIKDDIRTRVTGNWPERTF